MEMHKARYFSLMDNNQVLCELCPHECIIKEGKNGFCRVRANIGGNLYSTSYGKAVGMGIDPVEKKPLYHFTPGKQILSIGTPGCNLRCFYCQNCEISQSGVENFTRSREYSPEELRKITGKTENICGIAFTYNEPVVFFEYMMDTAEIFKKDKLKTVMVSNGYINPKPLNELTQLIDAFNIDLKSFDKKFYKKHTRSSLSPVLNSILQIAKAEKHMELTYLVIPGLNDNLPEFKSMVKWIQENTGEDTVLHLSRYFPRYNSNIHSTPISILEELHEVASDMINFVYLGNVSGKTGKDTYCPECSTLCISRNYFNIDNYLTSEGDCPSCGYKIAKT